MDVGCYCVSGSRYVAGEEPVEVFGQQVVTIFERAREAAARVA